jgi:hypothetical protein
MSALIISTLRDKRLEVADAIERLERQADQHRADLAHLEATMRCSIRTSSPKHSNQHHRAGATTGFVQANVVGASMTSCVTQRDR